MSTASPSDQIQDLITSYKKLIENVQKNKRLDSDELSLVSMTLLAVWTVFSILTPFFLRFLLGGFGFSEDYTAMRITHEYIRFSGAISFALLLLNYLSKRWNTESKRDLKTVMFALNAAIAVVTLLNIMSGAAFMHYLLLIIAAGFTFLYGKEAGLY